MQRIVYVSCMTDNLTDNCRNVLIMTFETEKGEAQGHQLMERGLVSRAFVSCKMLDQYKRRALVALKTRSAPCKSLRFLLSSTSDALVSIRGFRAFAHSSRWVAAGIFFGPGWCISSLQSAIKSMTVCSVSRFWAMASGNPLHGSKIVSHKNLERNKDLERQARLIMKRRRRKWVLYSCKFAVSGIVLSCRIFHKKDRDTCSGGNTLHSHS